MLKALLLPWREQGLVSAVEGDHGDRDGNEEEAHEDGTDNTDEERVVVPSANTLVEPLAVVVKDMDTLVTDRAVFGSGAADGDLTEVALPILYHMGVLALVQLGYQLLGIQGKEVGVRGIKQDGSDVCDVVEDKDEAADDEERQLEGRVKGWDKSKKCKQGVAKEDNP